MSNFKIGVEYKFANEDAEDEYSNRYSVNKAFAEALNEHGGTFKVVKYDYENSRVISVMFTDGKLCEDVLDEDNIIFECEFKYFTPVGTTTEESPDELVMTLSIHNRMQAITAISVLRNAYNC